MSNTHASTTPRTAENGVQTTWTYTLGSIVFFIAVLYGTLLIRGLSALSRSHNLIDTLIIVFLLASLAVQVRYCWFLRVGLGGGLPRPAWTTALFATAVVPVGLGLFSTDMWQFSPIPLWLAGMFIACLVPVPTRVIVMIVSLIVVTSSILFAQTRSESSLIVDAIADNAGIYFLTAFMPIVVLTSLWWWNIVIELDRHRRSAAELAIAKERLRFAADLHDIQGHHLQVIALKAELAERMLERDPAAAGEQLRETRQIASEALQETRSLVAGYRDVALDDELENAREVLTASGAACELRVVALPWDAAVRRALAFAVREATTNIIRHSMASNVTITVSVESGCCRLSVVNDGATPTDDATGTGLAGLRHRLAELGGALETHIGDSRFEFVATIPEPGHHRRSREEIHG